MLFLAFFVACAPDALQKIGNGDQHQRPPEIVSIEWGRVTVKEKGKLLEYQDCIITPDGSWKWFFNANTGINSPRTSHQVSGGSTKRDLSKGVQRHEVELYLHDIDAGILSTGMENKLGVNQDTVDFLKENGIEIYIVPTQNVKKLYDKLSRKKRVGAWIHSTC